MWKIQFNSYADCEAFFLKARSPAKGRPIRSVARMFKHKGVYVMKPDYYSIHEARGATEICRVYPNSTVEFVMPADHLKHSYTATSNIHTIIPILIHRYKTGKYRIDSKQTWEQKRVDSKNDKVDLWNRGGWQWMHSEAPQYFNGIKFDMATGICLNPQPDQKNVINPRKRKIWLRDLHKYKRHLKVTAKMGGMEVLRREYRPDVLNGYQKNSLASTEMVSPEWRKQLVSCMQQNTFPREITQVIAASTGLPYTRQEPNTSDYILHIDRIFTRLSEYLRKEYGVFKGSLHVKK